MSPLGMHFFHLFLRCDDLPSCFVQEMLYLPVSDFLSRLQEEETKIS